MSRWFTQNQVGSSERRQPLHISLCLSNKFQLNCLYINKEALQLLIEHLELIRSGYQTVRS